MLYGQKNIPDSQEMFKYLITEWGFLGGVFLVKITLPILVEQRNKTAWLFAHGHLMFCILMLILAK